MWRMKNKTLDGMDPDKIKRNSMTYAVLLVALGAMTFFGVCDPSGQVRGPSGAAAVVNGENISRNEFNRAYQVAYDRYQRQFADQFNPAQLRLAHNVMQELIDDRMMYQKALELGIRASDDEIIQLLAEEQSFKGEDGKFSDQIFERFLRSQGYTEASFLEEIRRNLTVQKLRRFVTEASFVSDKEAEIENRLNETKLNVEYVKVDPQKIDVKVSAADIDKFLADEAGKKRVKDYYDANQKEFNTEAQIKARHILVAFKEARNATPEAQSRSKEDAQKRAEEIFAQVKAPGADFVQIAKASTDEPAGKTSGGDLGYFGKDAMVKEFSDVAFTLNVGDISPVTETPFGFHIIKVEDKKAAKSVTLEQAERQIAQNILGKELRPQLAKEAAEQVLGSLKENKPVGDLLAQRQLNWEETGETALSSRYLPGIGASKEVNEVLTGLRRPGDLYPEVLDVRGNLYVLRLKARNEPAAGQLDKTKKAELAQSAAFSDGFAAYNAFEKRAREELDAKQKVWMNPEYLALDDQAAQEAAAGG